MDRRTKQLIIFRRAGYVSKDPFPTCTKLNIPDDVVEGLYQMVRWWVTSGMISEEHMCEPKSIMADDVIVFLNKRGFTTLQLFNEDDRWTAKSICSELMPIELMLD